MSKLLMKYFVLKPSGRDIYGSASRRAMLAYADEIKKVDPVFSKEIVEWAVESQPGGIDLGRVAGKKENSESPVNNTQQAIAGSEDSTQTAQEQRCVCPSCGASHTYANGKSISGAASAIA